MRAFLIITGLVLANLVRAEDMLVIASPNVPVSSITTSQLADIYTAQKKFWGNNLQVVPVNREASSELREQFSRAVFDMSTRELGAYWNRLTFEGKLPPIIQQSDQAVLGFVRSVPGAIGYISSDQQPVGVKVLLRLP